MKRIGIIATVALATTAFVAAPASAHTGSITREQSCDTMQTRVFAHLDANVADTSQWVVRVNGQARAHGTGPGPADLGPYITGPAAGSASLTIDFEDEHNVYTTDWPAITPCTTPHVYAPAAEILQPCGDPLFRARLDNRASDHSVVFVLKYHAYRGDWVRASFRIPGGIRWVTPHFHGTGGTVITVTGRGRTLDKERLAAPGDYPYPCS